MAQVIVPDDPRVRDQLQQGGTTAEALDRRIFQHFLFQMHAFLQRLKEADLSQILPSRHTDWRARCHTISTGTRPCYAQT